MSSQIIESRRLCDSSAFSVGFVPLYLKARGENGDKVLWANPAPNSPFCCRNLVFSFEKETDALTYSYYQTVAAEVANLENITLNVRNIDYQLLAQHSTFESTMFDGKSVVAITRNITDRTLSTQACQLCFKLPKQFSLSPPNQPVDDLLHPELVKLGISCLHLWLRCMEFLWNLSIRMFIGHRVSMNSAEFQLRKQYLQTQFRHRLKLDIFKVNEMTLEICI